MFTPWGIADYTENIGKGIISVATPSHGGIFVPDHLLHHIPAKLQQWAKKWSRSTNWYEKDCCWSAVALTFPELFEKSAYIAAKSTIKQYFPEFVQ